MHVQRQEELQIYAAAAAAAGSGGLGGEAGEKEVPEDLLDPITMELMWDPVVLPDSQVSAASVLRLAGERRLCTAARR